LIEFLYQHGLMHRQEIQNQFGLYKTLLNFLDYPPTLGLPLSVPYFLHLIIKLRSIKHDCIIRPLTNVICYNI